jgi:uncharacterized protein (DUF885 family)
MLRAAVAALLLLAGCATAPGAPPPAQAAAIDAKSELASLLAAYEAYARDADPVTAGAENDRAALRRWPDVTPAAIAAQRETLEGLKRRLAAIAAAPLAAEDALNRDYLARVVALKLDGLSFDEERMPLTNTDGFFTTPDFVADTTPINSLDDAEAWIARLDALAKYYDDNIANMRRGLATGFVQPRIVAEAALKVIRAQAADKPARSHLLAPFRKWPASIPPGQQAALRARAERIIAEKIAPARAAFLKFFETEYLPKTRPGLAARDLPNGEAYYAYLIREHTTTTMTPDEIHDLGLAEVRRIRAEMDALIRETGFKGSFSDFLKFLRRDKRFYVSTREALLDQAAVIGKRADDQLPHLFATLPRLPWGVREMPRDVEETEPPALYYQGSPDLGMAGAVMVTTSHLDQRPLYGLPTLMLHEGVPGHHLQIALSQELKNLPYVRRNSAPTAFVEGWGLYAESLGDEMGMYRTPYERFGHLSFEMWRACRLVADTGIHWKRWSLAQAHACFEQNTALSRQDIDTEVLRYVAWPGQALAYKIGELKIKALRAEAQKALGVKFDVRRFHDAVLLGGAMPLDLLESRVRAWIAATKG